MAKKVIIIFVISIFYNLSFAQRLLTNNLVINPSFESYTQCPDNVAQIKRAFPWSDCVGGIGSDFYHSCCSLNWMIQVLNMQHPRTGNGEAGIYVYGLWIDHNYRDYIIDELYDYLKNNKKYCSEFYVSLSNASKGAIENIGMYFSVDTVYNSNGMFPLVNLQPQIENHNGIIKDTMNWVKINGIFNALGGERYITIGNFKDNIHTNYIEVSYGAVAPYYFLDDVSVCECSFEFSLGKDTTLCDGETLLLNPNMPNAIYTWQDSSHSATYKVTKTGTYWVRAYFPDYNITTSSSINVIYNGECIKIPNVFTPNNDNKNDYFVITNTEGWNVDLQVYSRWGNIVFQDADYKNNWDGKDNAKPLADGVYYYIIKATSQNSGISKEYKGSVTILR